MEENDEDVGRVAICSKSKVVPVQKQLEWAEVKDPASGKVYFYNAATGESTWTDPRGPIAEWAEVKDV